MVCVADDIDEVGSGMTAIVEIFFPGGCTPPNVHRKAHELFFVLYGSGRASYYVDGQAANAHSVTVSAGDSLLLPPGTWHVIENTAATKLYCLTVMVPNEDFAELIHSGIPTEMDDEDRRVLLHCCADVN
jgi:mannose-6-phosphate isomerase-like protein (cupin superfamily)